MTFNLILSVAHYGHPLLKGAKHWSFLLHQSDRHAIMYQITGSTNTYEFKEPEQVDILDEQSYMGRVTVGSVDTAKQQCFDKVLRNIPVTRGNLQWNCQNWIVEALKALQDSGFDVDALTHEDLGAKLQQAKREI
jgi:hypothetical protein